MTARAGETISRPDRLAPGYDLSGFNSGVTELDDWLRQRAVKNELEGASRTYVVAVGPRVIGYFALSTGSVARERTPGAVRRNMPDPVPVIILARLAVDVAYQNKGIGRGMVKDAILRAVTAAEIVGVRAILVHALSPKAKAFYESLGFTESPVDPMTLMLSIREAAREITAVAGT